MTFSDFCDAPGYYLGIVWPATFAAPTMVEWSAIVANVARGLGLRRLALKAAVWGYDIADHDPADACWSLHRQRFVWAYCRGSFRPAHMLAAARLHQRRFGDLV